MFSSGMDPNDRTKTAQVLLTTGLMGAVVDFLTNGVFKIQFAWIYGTLYIALAATLQGYLYRGRFTRFATGGTVTFLVGAVLGHLVFSNQLRTRTYPMDVVADQPLALHSPKFSDTLFVNSEKVRSKLAAADFTRNVPVTIQVVVDYGCIQSFKVSAIAGVDVMLDSDARWTWRLDPRFVSAPTKFSGMNEENARIPWCRIHWF